jgi:hypothetical protein
LAGAVASYFKTIMTELEKLLARTVLSNDASLRHLTSIVADLVKMGVLAGQLDDPTRELLSDLEQLSSALSDESKYMEALRCHFALTIVDLCQR